MVSVTPADVTAILELVDGGVGLREISGRTSVPLSMVRALVSEHRPDVSEQLLAKAQRKRVTRTGLTVSINTDERGLCAVCGHECSLMGNGRPRPHKQRRVRLGEGGVAQVYATAVECDGLLHPAEPLEVPCG